MKQISFTNQNQRNIQAYIEYRNIVGQDDNGKLMSEDQFEEYKKKVSESRKNHLYIYWVNCNGFECKAIGPESMCFCNHRFKYHDFDSVKDKNVKCKDKKCKCKLFDYVPVYGANDVKCLCHHSYREHTLIGTRKCTRAKCKCTAFGSKFTCNCGYGYDMHKTVIQNREERESEGKPVDPGWFGGSLIAGGMNNYGGMMNDVYEGEFQALEKKPGEKKVMYSNGIPVEKGNNSGEVKGKGMRVEEKEIGVKEDNKGSWFDLANTPCVFFNKGDNVQMKGAMKQMNKMKIGK